MCDLEGVDFDIDMIWKKNITLNEDENNLVDVHFEYFFPRIVGHTKLIDECYSNMNSPCWKLVCHDKIKFKNEESDPDWIVN